MLYYKYFGRCIPIENKPRNREDNEHSIKLANLNQAAINEDNKNQR